MIEKGGNQKGIERQTSEILPPRNGPVPGLPLSLARAGNWVRIVSISGKDESRRQLRNLGFVENEKVYVVSETGGNVIVSVKGSRMAISKVMARRVMTV
ncbi:MAG: FeoA family protein [Sporolactobacillus sp.]